MKNSIILNNHQKIIDDPNYLNFLVDEKLQAIKKSFDKKEHVILDFYSDEVRSKIDSIKSLNTTSIYRGITFLLKDNINYKGHITTSGSLVMKDFVSPYNATIVDKINESNCIILGKTNLDEFGHGGTGLSSAFGYVLNPFDNNKIVGGSSSGSVVAIKLGMCDIAIGTDTGDSIRHPASYLGVVGFKPSYGVVSRYGITPYASSLDHVGLFSQSVIDCAIGFDIIKGFDPKDYTSIDLDVNCLEHLDEIDLSKIKIAVLDDVVSGLNSEIHEKWDKFILDLKNETNLFFTDFDKNLLDILSPLYASISFVEGLTNWNNVNGILFANKDIDYKNYEDLLVKSRSLMGDEVKNRYLIADLFSNEENFDITINNSQKIRQIIVNRVNQILDNYDAILIPSSSCYAPKVEDVLNNKSITNYCDDALMIANFAGLPSISIPLTSNKNSFSFNININCKKFNDLKALQIAHKIEEFIIKRGYYD